MELRDKKILVVGLGKTGWATARHLKNIGGRVKVTESRTSPELQEKSEWLRQEGIEVEIGQHSEEFSQDCDLVIPCPGVPPESLPLKIARASGKPVWSEIEVAYRLSPTRKILAVTGTNGKTTTTALLGSLLNKAGWSAVVCGNIGNPFIGELERLSEATWVVLEVSSFQLEYIHQFTPEVGILLNITPDHLDRYANLEEYARVKFRLFSRQTKSQWAILNQDDPFCCRLAEQIDSRTIFFGFTPRRDNFWYEAGSIWTGFSEARKEVCRVEGVKLIGTGNLQNMMAVAAVSVVLKIGRRVVEETLRDFQPLPHRMEEVAEINGVRFVNDSKSTNADSVRKALEAFPRKSVVLIMGGKDKGFSFSELRPIVGEKTKALILLGETARKIAQELEKSGIPMVFAPTLEEAVKLGYQEASRGETILLSPGCSSFDMFTDYKERGDVFKKTVQTLLQAVRG
ncbi:MAG: UDP-N-acetylmuramoyl-L-alanine--D-glutamate ligase [Candidatus Omnitrophica bacterium]|nr:UDP-N-acetylmuramoyl-L-alanine--D-glutamate ligase [Candidatus Omnitrophota bacterium]